jgi:hypothetical protein
MQDLMLEVCEGEGCWQSAGFWVFWGVWSMF